MSSRHSTGQDLSARAMGIAAGVLADAVFGDPRRGHPVALFGTWAGWLERRLYRPSRQRGAVFTAIAAGTPVVAVAVADRLCSEHPAARAGLTALATWTALGGTSLAREGARMATALEAGHVLQARELLTHLCARDPSGLEPPELARATVESLAENTSDAVVAPLFWAAVAGPAGVIGYRAVNTLDAMVGYRSPRYEHFGWAAARVDDVVNLLPSRLTALITIAAASSVQGAPGEAWAVWRRDRGRHPSPNAGQCEASAAGALGVRLGGTNVYGEQVESRPVMGEGNRAPDVGDVRRAVKLGRWVGALAAAGAVVGVVGAARGRAWR
ncbi:cobalamin biosynthesis protein [Kineosporia rhizophila]|uniref:cobalamin biosynthesis protein n=1 Tax=Kineosporia TaxID=49184 RepID=UPI001E3417E3|nr:MULTISPECIES: cobalamin biosynthesis protein [Kineosporia]MCE0534665.1 cobalamin biosynthesis protein [Kineosporia rhizophila]GLY15544.1 cobalamin biosynthesis protein CobD [Kineosporia sp. NBRC 101677]